MHSRTLRPNASSCRTALWSWRPRRGPNVGHASLAALLMCLSIAVAAPDGRAAPAPVGTTTAFTLGNGLEVVVIEDHRVATVTHMVWYKVGAIDDPAGASGLAHLLEHLMFKAFDAGSEETFAQRMSRLGAIDNARTAHDWTYYFQRVASESLEEVMGLEAYRMRSLVLTAEQVRTERNVVREERRTNFESDPVKLLTEQVYATLYQNHNYARPPIGWSHEIGTLELAAARAFYDRYYVPSNAVVVIAGDVSVEEVRRLAEKTYGRVPPGPASVGRAETRPPEAIAARRVELIDPRTPRPTLFRYYLAPSYKTARPSEAESLEILMAVLGDGESSRMHRVLVSEMRTALAVGARYFGDGRDAGHIALFGLVGNGGSLTGLEAELDRLLKDVVENGVTDAEIARAKASIEARLVFARDNQMELATRTAEALAVSRTLEDVARHPERIASVTRADIERAARDFLLARRSVTGLLIPERVARTTE